VTIARFPYVEVDPSLGAVSAMPYLPIRLIHNQQEVQVSELVDSGATLNVLPYDIGHQLGAVWAQQTVPVRLSGNLAACEARALLVTAQAAEFPAVRLAFAWTNSNDLPVILGQINFFLEFDVCFLRSRLLFEIRQRGTTLG
jgi:hypothetical protein